ncbi:MAG TPA: hypothetical protein PKY56_04915, partial [Candidatus Kapabacteria bacterium]|nr:hypothetical protein [Candidatus Kapabacteria bacterium]
MKNKSIICFDLGTTSSKYIIKKDCQIKSYNIINNNNLDNLIEQYSNNQSFGYILLTGSNASKYKCENKIISINELEAIANITKHLEKESGLVISIGTGTAFVKYNQSKYEHLIGTGIGGGTFAGLGKLLLNTNNPKELEELAKSGDISNINTTIADILYNTESWFENDVTVSNFGKPTGNQADIAIGLHSLIVEPILSILVALTLKEKFENIIFTGAVLKNSIIRKIINKYAKLFQFDVIFLDNPEFGTCYG